MYEGQLVAKLSEIDSGANPREYFDAAELESLAATIKAVGVIEPIIVRQKEGGRFTIIAGERRWRASKLAFGDDGVIPIIVRDCSDAESEVIALIENDARAAMSATEEGQQAQKVLARHGGNRQEAAAQLGWTVAKLDRRVALMRLTPEVRKALNERKILLGHAELLAAVPSDKQDSTLEKIIQHDVPVATLKAQLGKLTESLADAAFDKTECASCEYNSECQSALFGEAIGAGFCTNRACYESKTMAMVDSVAAALQEDVPRVEVLRSGGSLEGIKIVAAGSLGVGDAQASACKSCANFGCTVSALPGSVGEVERSICFDAACHTTKVQANIASIAATKTATAVAEAKVKASGGSEQEAKSAGKAAAKSTEASAKAKVTAITSTKVKEYRLEAWRKIAAKVLYSKPEYSLAVLVALAVSHKISHVDSSKVRDASKRHGGDLAYSSGVSGTASVLVGMSTDDRASVVNALAPSAIKKLDEHDIGGILNLLKVDLADHWKLNAEFLGLLTKSEIEYLATEVGIATAIGDKGFAKALNGKRDELIKAVLTVEGFQYKGVVPKCMALSAPIPDGSVQGAENTEVEDEVVA